MDSDKLFYLNKEDGVLRMIQDDNGILSDVQNDDESDTDEPLIQDNLLENKWLTEQEQHADVSEEESDEFFPTAEAKENN